MAKSEDKWTSPDMNARTNEALDPRFEGKVERFFIHMNNSQARTYWSVTLSKGRSMNMNFKNPKVQIVQLLLSWHLLWPPSILSTYNIDAGKFVKHMF